VPVKYVIVYQDDADSDRGKAVIGNQSAAPTCTITQIPDQTDEVTSITGSATDTDGTIDNVMIRITNMSTGYNWNGDPYIILTLFAYPEALSYVAKKVVLARCVTSTPYSPDWNVVSNLTAVPYPRVLPES